jgi:mono/diheme cytochrome c family protein
MIALLFVLLAQANLPTPAPVPPAATHGELPVAAETYGRRCSICHGFDGKGQTRRGEELGVPDFTSAAWQKGTTDEHIVHVITYGGKKRGMISFSDRMTTEEIAAMVPFLRSLGAAQK